MKPQGICPASHKVGYANEAGAKIMLGFMQDHGHDVCRVYECPSCCNWHLTSMPLADVRRPSFGRRFLARLRRSFEVWPT